MYLDGTTGVVLSPTDVTGYLECRHLTALDLQHAQGTLPAPPRVDPMFDIVTGLGMVHEREHLDRLRARCRTVVEIPDSGDLRAREEATAAAMRAGADVIYQATFRSGRWRGHADFLLKRDDRPSALGSWSYDVADTKLARALKVPALLQMASYAEHLVRLQRTPPEFLTVLLGDGTAERFRHADCAAYFRRVRRDIERWVDTCPEAARPEPVPHCSVCRWQPTCTSWWEEHDDLTLVASMRRDQARRLAEAGLATVAELGAADPGTRPRGLAPATWTRLREQARLQLEERRTGHPVYDLLPVEEGRGLARLPEPSPGDLFFDMEGDPFHGDDGLEYLFGVVDTTGRFSAYWAHDLHAERRAFEQVVDRFIAGWRADPGMHVYHYAPYEQSALKRLMGRHATREEEVDRLLRGQRLVDLYAVVREGVRISRPSYSIKELEVFYRKGGRTGAAVHDAAGSIVAYEHYLHTGDVGQLDEIASYNEADCTSTRQLRDWLEARRAGLEPLPPRPNHTDGRAAEEQELATAQVVALAAGLRAVGDPTTALLGDLLDWHRREARPEWWEYFHRKDMTDEELVDDTASLGQLSPPTDVGRVKSSTRWRFTFPAQDTKFGPGARVIDPRTGTFVGTVDSIDPAAGWVVLRRATASTVPRPTALVPDQPIQERAQRQRLFALGEWVRDHELDGPGSHRSARDLLLRRPPRLRAANPAGPLRREGETAENAVLRLTGDLDGGVLAVQGPPGSGKTWIGARAVVELAAAGRRVGVTAFSHQAITNLLTEITTVARARRCPLRIVQKAEAGQGCPDEQVRCTTDNSTLDRWLAEGADVVAGTSWLFCRPELDQAVDTLVVDEAGQLSLANVLAVAGAARNLVLLGDPRQLNQPARGVHPPGAGASALDHLLAGAATIRADLGIFLDTTHRMHPEVCRFVSEVVYDGRLRSDPSCAVQRLTPQGVGLRWLPVDHADNRSSSREEADAVLRLLDTLLGSTWTGADGTTAPLRLADVLVVTPYNAQVHLLRSVLPPDARVGTVDRFQGQQAPVVIYSLASSSAADAPRDVGFLFNLNRFNVAISRARGLAVVVGSPRLLDSPVRTPDQLRLVNAVCRYVEEAEPVRW